MNNITTLLIYKILQLSAVMIVGFILAKLKVIKYDDSSVLSKISLYLLVPSAIINAFDFEMTQKITGGLTVAFAVAVLLHIVYYVLDKLYGRLISNNSVERASVMYPNSGNLIMPIVAFVLGEEWVVFSVAFLAVQILFFWTHCIRVFSSKEKLNIRKIIFNVNIIAVIAGIGIMIFGFRLPGFVKDVTTSFSSMMGTVGMLTTGILAAKVDFKKIIANIKIYRVMLFRLVVYPLISLVILKLLALTPIIKDEKILFISFLACAAPTAVTVMQFAQIRNDDAEYAAAINIFTTVACIITMPLLSALFDLI